MVYLRLDKIGFRYGKNQILDNLSLTVNKGEIFGLMGSNGCGKTTILKMLCGLLEPMKDGKILLNEKEIKPDKEKRIIGYCPQENSFFEKLTVKENLVYFAHLNNFKGNFDRLVRGTLKSIDLSNKINELACNLSGGMKRRLNIACGILHGPEILLLDEPTIELDPKARNKIWELIGAIKRLGTTIIIATNTREEAQALCDNVALIDEDRVVMQGAASEIPRMI